MRENRLTHHSRNSETHLTYAEALKRSGYVGDNGVVVLSKRMSAAPMSIKTTATCESRPGTSS